MHEMKTETPLSDRIAQCALKHYEVLPNNGGKPQRTEWTVYAAIVAARQQPASNDSVTDQELWVVCSATGSKCTSVRPVVSKLPTRTKQYKGRKRPHSELSDADTDHKICSCYNGMVLKDSHAETLTRRGLMAVLWNEVESLLQNKSMPRSLLEPNEPSQDVQQQFKLRDDLSLHMYISDNPCGDATIYRVEKPTSSSSCKDQPETSINFTGAKIILSGSNGQSVVEKNESISSTLTCSESKDAPSTSVTLGREDTQQLGALRLKSSRSNIPSHLRTLSMSCSDKLVRWGCLGLGGALLSMYIPKPIVLSSICVSKDPRAVDIKDDLGQLDALKRALTDRIENALASLKEAGIDWSVAPPVVAVVDYVFENSKSSSESRQYERLQKGSDSATNTKGRVIKESPCGMSINWHQTNTLETSNTEVTIGSTGLKRGKKPKCPIDVVKSASRLSRYHFASCCRRCNSVSSETAADSEATNYWRYKRILSSENVTKAQTVVLGGKGPLVGWVRGNSEDDFNLPHD